MNATTMGDFLKSIIPISRFNKGEANRIFDEVRGSGYKVVMKNNNPACVLISPDDFTQMLEYAEDYLLLLEANKRMEKAQKGIPLDEVMKTMGVCEADLEDIVVEFE